jgi:hypothetical protein
MLINIEKMIEEACILIDMDSTRRINSVAASERLKARPDSFRYKLRRPIEDEDFEDNESTNDED